MAGLNIFQAVTAVITAIDKTGSPALQALTAMKVQVSKVGVRDQNLFCPQSKYVEIMTSLNLNKDI